MLRSEKQLEGTPIHASDGAIGKITDTYLDDEHWVLRYVVVDTGKWLESRAVLIASAQLQPGVPEIPGLRVAATMEQVRHSPSADSERPVSRQHEQRIHDYFGWPYYWGAASMAGIPLAVPPVVPTIPSPGLGAEAPRPGAGRPSPLAEEPDDAGDPHLRSAKEIRGAQLAARDGALGHVEDLLLDERSWAVRYLVVDTRNWWPGKKVLLAPRWVQRVAWPDLVATVSLDLDEIRGAPEYVPGHSPSERTSPRSTPITGICRRVAERERGSSQPALRAGGKRLVPEPRKTRGNRG
ncbi:MAG: PRC-barrel domain-containing protein [Opitutaceae bacterium]